MQSLFGNVNVECNKIGLPVITKTHTILASLLALVIILWMLQPPCRVERVFTYDQEGATVRAVVIEGRLLSLEIEEDGDVVYMCQTKAAFHWLSGYNAKWLNAKSFLLYSGDIGSIDFEKGDNGKWKAKNIQQIHMETSFD